jgi:outer membrane protein OmpA-like peptidoglycan-associated protein
MLKPFIFILVLCFANLTHSQNDTIALYYDIGIYKLDSTNYSKIQSKLNRLNDNEKYQVQIISSCDFLGSNSSNLLLSSQRAITVRNLLITKKNVTITSITYKGVGEIPSKGFVKNDDGIPNHRRTLLIFKDEMDVVLDHIADSKSGDIFILKNIIFDPGRHLLKKESIPIIRKLLKVLQDNPKLEIELSGHVCCGKNPTELIDGYDKDTKTYDLSKNRAKHIYNYLILKKVDSSRLTYKGFGFQKPLIFPEKTEKEKKMNRRVEVKILKN